MEKKTLGVLKNLSSAFLSLQQHIFVSGGAVDSPKYQGISPGDRAAKIKELLNVGRAALRSGDLERAEAAFLQVIAIDPKHVGARGDMVITRIKEGNISQAVKAVREALAIAPQNVGLLTQLGHLLNRRTNWTDAAAAFQAALKLDPTNAGALGGLASTLTRQDKGEEALAVLRKATSLWPKNAGMHIRLGQALEEHHRLGEAAVAFQSAVSVDPENRLALVGLRRVRNPIELFELIRLTLADCADDVARARLCLELAVSEAKLLMLINFVRGPREADIDALAETPLEHGVLHTILCTNQRQDFWRRNGVTAPLQRLRVMPPSMDILAAPSSHESWIPAQWFSYYLLRQIQARHSAAVVVTMRDEGLYLLEWVAHYRALGFSTIFVYSNDNIDGSESLLRELADAGIITYIENQMDSGHNHHPQRKAYAHALHLMPELWEHEWVLFADSDEFLVPADIYNLNIGALLDDAVKQHPERAPSAICFNWVWYVSGETYSYEPELLLKRFQHGLGKRGMKSFVRLRDIFSMHLIHFPDMDHEGFLVKSDFTLLEKFFRQKRLDPVFGSGRLNHYWHKSFEEFSVKKARGDAAGDRDKFWRRDFELFFSKNAAETDENYLPPSEALVLAVEEDLRKLRLLPGIKNHEAAIRSRFPNLLSRFDEEGGLQSIYETFKSANAKPPV